MQCIYLDHHSTTPIDPRVARAIADCYQMRLLNPASQHQLGRQAYRLLHQARNEIAGALGAQLAGPKSDRLVLTSGGTEANNMAIMGLAAAPPGRILVSAIEHPSVLEPARRLSKYGFELDLIPASPSGRIAPQRVLDMLDGDVRLVSLGWVNHETGVIQPVEEVAAECRSRGIPFHCDAVQAVGKIPVNFRHLGAATMSVAAHKFHGPRGIGALLVAPWVASIEPLLTGGPQQLGLRAGTEDVALAVGMAEALRLCTEQLEGRAVHMQRLRDKLESAMIEQFPQAVVLGGGSSRAPGACNVAFPGIDRQILAMALDAAGVAVSTGSACASGSSEPSPVLRAMGLEEALIRGSIRISLGASTTEVEIQMALERILRTLNNLCSPRQQAEIP